MIYERKFIFRRTILDIPLLVFLGSQIISTIISIDPQTSWLGYYSRFNGGLLSIVCYILLYWAFTANIDIKGAKRLINTILWSATIVSVYGVLEHFGIDKSLWQQDVQSRVFSTLGQPNWLAAWLVALIPITWVNIIKSDFKSKSFWLSLFFSVLFFWTLIFTKSRSGLVGMAGAFIIFWGGYFWFNRRKIKTILAPTFSVGLSLLVICLISGTQFTPSLKSIIQPQKEEPVEVQASGTVLEVGGTESGTIRKIVWEGALEVWKHYPVFGTGVETFAYSYYLFRPVAHNLTTEWDFIYNKAHNEYLNYLANTGAVGILSYLVMIGFTLYLMGKNIFQKDRQGSYSSLISLAFVSGYTSILITNFFGFSVVPIQILFYLFPALSIVLASEELHDKEQKINVTPNQKLLGWLIIFVAGFLIIFICRYWYADTLYSNGANYNKVNRQDLSPEYLNRAINLEPNQSIYYAERSKAYTNLALAYNEAKQSTTASQLIEIAIEDSIKAVNLSPANVNLKRIEFGVFVMLSTIDQNYLLDARDVLVAAVTQAPTDAKLFYNLGLIYSRLGQNDLALQTLGKTVELKANYKDARLAYAILLIDAKRSPEAVTQLEYILTRIDPSDSVTKQYLESIK